jgi:hypothetical protein
MHELTMQTFWGTPLALLPSAILLNWVVQQRIAALCASPSPDPSTLRARSVSLRKASLASGFAVAGSALAALTSGAFVVFRVSGQMPLLAMQTLVLIGLLVAAARVTVDGHVALAELVDDDTPPPNDRAL